MKLSKVKLGMKVVLTSIGFGVFCNHNFRKGEVGKVVGIDTTDGVFTVLFEGDEDSDWVSHKNLKKFKCNLPQSLFDGLDPEWIYAAKDKNGEVSIYVEKPVRNDGIWFNYGRWDDIYTVDLDVVNCVSWKKSLTKRKEK
jgi:hypothetical protein